MSSSNSPDTAGQAKPKSILKNKSSSTTLVDPRSTNSSTTAASTPSVPDQPSNDDTQSREGHHYGLRVHPMPELPPAFIRLDHLTQHTQPHSHTDNTPASPYSASFDPNVSSSATATPAVPPRSSYRPSSAGSLTHSHSSSLSAQSASQAQEQWTQIMSASLNALAAQFSAASQSLLASSGSVPEAAPEEAVEDARHSAAATNLALSKTVQNGQETILILQRLESIEKTQSHLLSKIASLENSTAAQPRDSTNAVFESPARQTEVLNEPEIEEVPNTPSEKKEKEKQVEAFYSNQQDLGPLLTNLISRLEGVESRLAGLEGKADSVSEMVRLDQTRLYPRLLNSNVPLNKNAIHPLPMANGKPPPNYPATKGEFEHLTKERYENLLKAYGVPIKGDTNAKREALREFIGLTPPGK